MLSLKTLAAIMLIAMAMSFGAPQAFAGEISTPGFTGDMHTPSADGEIGAPGLNGDMNFPVVNGDMHYPILNGGIMDTPGFNGWIGTGLAAIVSLFG